MFQGTGQGPQHLEEPFHLHRAVGLAPQPGQQRPQPPEPRKQQARPELTQERTFRLTEGIPSAVRATNPPAFATIASTLNTGTCARRPGPKPPQAPSSQPRVGRWRALTCECIGNMERPGVPILMGRLLFPTNFWLPSRCLLGIGGTETRCRTDAQHPAGRSPQLPTGSKVRAPEPAGTISFPRAARLCACLDRTL